MDKIPKRIHYCWFGGAEKNTFIKECMKTWGVYLPDYEVIEWNEDNFDVNMNNFVKEAYRHKKWAFVSDYARMYTMYKYGGIYMDTDVEVKDNLDQFLNHRAFACFESKYTPFNPALFGAEKGHPWVKSILDLYKNISILNDDGTMNLTPNTIHVSKLMIEKYNVKTNNKYQCLEGDVHLYPNTYFCRPSSSNNYAIHHCEGAWITGKKKIVRDIIKKILGKELFLKALDMRSDFLFALGFKKLD